MGTIKAHINDKYSPAGEWFEFDVIGYGQPVEIHRYRPNWDDRPVWYLNSSGYAQRFDEKRPPFSGDSRVGVRLLLAPAFDEVAVMQMLAARHLGD